MSRFHARPDAFFWQLPLVNQRWERVPADGSTDSSEAKEKTSFRSCQTFRDG